MASPYLFTLLRRTRPSYLHSLVCSSSSHFNEPIFPKSNALSSSSSSSSSSLLLSPHTTVSSLHPAALFNFSFSRSFSSHNHNDFDSDDINSALTQSEFANPQLAVAGSYDESILPVRALISLLDSYHDLTGFPWWIVIASSTVMMRLTLFPFIILQLQKMKKIGELLPKLPPPFPPPLSGRSFRDQLTLFMKEKRAAGCPSLSWFFASLAVQVPCFFLWITSIRRMSLDHHPGFDSGGILWFQNLTEYPNGALGPFVPLLIAGLHFTNVQLSFQKSSTVKMPGMLGLLAKYYKNYLEILTVPILFATFNIPQGSSIYWLTNSSLSLVQQFVLKHPDVRLKLGLPVKEAPRPAAKREGVSESGLSQGNQSRKQGKYISAKDLSPVELVNLSVVYLSQGNKDKALPLLRLALDKDPEYPRALLIMGQILMKDKLPKEAAEYFERAVDRISLSGDLTEIEVADVLILSSQCAGVAYIQQGKYEEGILHLERVANLEEPEDRKIKAHYYDGLVLLSGALYDVGRKAEAVKYLRMVAAYDAEYTGLLQEWEKEDLLSDLVNSRRADY